MQEQKLEREESISMNVDQMVDEAANAITKGRIIMYPTDTIWGLGCDIGNESAVKYVRKIKQAPDDFAMVLLVNNIMMLKQFIFYIHPRIETLLLYHHQPLTLIYDANENVPHHLLNADKRIAIRVCQDDFCNEIMFKINRPLLATSASLAGEKYPKNFSEINDELKTKVDLILPLRQNEEQHLKPSIIATFNKKGDLQFIRK